MKSGPCNFAPTRKPAKTHGEGLGCFRRVHQTFFPPPAGEKEIIASGAPPGLVCLDCRVLSEGDLKRASGDKDVISMKYGAGSPLTPRVPALARTQDESQREGK